MANDEVRISRTVLEDLCSDIDAYKSADPADDAEFNEMMDTLDRIHESLDAILALKEERS